MSHFYGTLQGNRGQATRGGSRDSGITTQAAGWGGAIKVETFVGDDGKDQFAIHLTPWKGSGGRARLIACGHLDANAERVITEGTAGLVRIES